MFRSQIVASEARATTSFPELGVQTTPTQGVGVVGGLGGIGLSGVHPAKGARWSYSSSKPLNLNLCKISPVVPSRTSTNPSVLARASLVSSGENSSESTGAGLWVAKLRAPVNAVEQVTKPKRGAGGAVPGGGAGAAPPQATLNPSWLQLAAATECCAVPSISATKAELVLTTAAPFAPTLARHINEPSGDRAAWRAPSHSTDWRLSIVFFRCAFCLSRRAGLAFAAAPRLLPRTPACLNV